MLKEQRRTYSRRNGKKIDYLGITETKRKRNGTKRIHKGQRNRDSEQGVRLIIEEIEDAIEKIKPGNSPGIDEITPKKVKYSRRTETIALKQIFNKALKEGEAPIWHDSLYQRPWQGQQKQKCLDLHYPDIL
ncbi:hypothetical protein ILUMI_21388 [Ignelater luminosus]|uniref:Uncharacterized protein n=1 Tax=Ignelater luminosus TaxID=2038154 RepID=A0A8K0CFP2_IGNLU|nr:hypothetical protein ILUMI_21388 [Ignelater luminosus]